MANLWEKVKQTLEQSTKTVKAGAETMAKTFSEKAPQITTSLSEKGRKLAASVSDKTQELAILGQLKFKHYNLNHEVSNLFTKIGGRVYELMKNKGNNIYSDNEVKKMIENVKKLEQEIESVEKEMKAQKTKVEKKAENKVTAEGV